MSKKKFIEANQRFQKLVTIKRVEDFDGMSDTRAQWLCKCDCGNEVVRVNRSLTRNKSNSCGRCVNDN